MKKMLFGLMATIMFGFAGNAQNNTFTKSSMVVLVNQAKQSFTKGMSYKDWVTIQTGNSTIPIPQEDVFMKDVYGFLSTNSNSETIYKNYEGSSLLELAKFQSKGELTLFSSTNARCGFFCQLGQALLHAILDFLESQIPKP